MTVSAPRILDTACSTVQRARLPVAQLLVCLGLLGLPACTDQPGVTVHTDVDAVGSSKRVTTADKGASLDVPDNLPAIAPAYPGARLATRIAGGEGGNGTLMVFETSDPIARVVAFYDAQAQRSSARAAVVVNEEDTAVRIYGPGKGKTEGALIAISRSADGPTTEIVITAGMAPDEVARMETKPGAWRDRVRLPVRLQ